MSRYLEGLDEEDPLRLFYAFEREIDEAVTNKKAFSALYGRLETTAITKAEIEKLGANLHHIKEDVLNECLNKFLEGVQNSYMYLALHHSITPLHHEDIGGANSYNILLQGIKVKSLHMHRVHFNY